MSTAAQKVASTLERDADGSLKDKHRTWLGSDDRGSAPLDALSASRNDWLRMRHIAAAHRTEAVRLAEHALWSQHNADVCWYSGRLRAARQFDAQAARQRELAAWLTAEAGALGGSS